MTAAGPVPAATPTTIQNVYAIWGMDKGCPVVQVMTNAAMPVARPSALTS